MYMHIKLQVKVKIPPPFCHCFEKCKLSDWEFFVQYIQRIQPPFFQFLEWPNTKKKNIKSYRRANIGTQLHWPITTAVYLLR